MSTQAPSVACLLLAAGASRRMGRDKLRLPFGAGSSVLEQTALALSRAPISQQVLVVRSRTQLLFDPDCLGFEVLEIGDEANQGMHRSLKLGLSRLAPEIAAVMVCLGDQPFIRTEDYSLLLEAYLASVHEGLDLLCPAKGGQNISSTAKGTQNISSQAEAGERGNPAVIHRRYFEEIFHEPDGDRGCRYLFERYPDRVRAWEPPTSAFFRDLDTPEDYRTCLN